MGLIWFLFFNDISTIVSYLMPNSCLKKNDGDTIKPISDGIVGFKL